MHCVPPKLYGGPDAWSPSLTCPGLPACPVERPELQRDAAASRQVDSPGLTINGIASKISFVRPQLPPFLNEARLLNLQVKVLPRSGEVELVVVV
jgi:hypothetical protein